MNPARETLGTPKASTAQTPQAGERPEELERAFLSLAPQCRSWAITAQVPRTKNASEGAAVWGHRDGISLDNV